MSDDDLVRRGDVRREFADYCAAAGDDFNSTLDRVPVPPSPRITRADAAARLDATLRKMAEADHAPRVACPKCFAEFPVPPSPAERLARAYIAWLDGWKMPPAEFRAKLDELDAATAAYRAAQPDSAGAAPPAAEPAPSPGVRDVEFVMGGSFTPPRCPVHGLVLPCGASECGNREPAAEPAPCPLCKGQGGPVVPLPGEKGWGFRDACEKCGSFGGEA